MRRAAPIAAFALLAGCATDQAPQPAPVPAPVAAAVKPQLAGIQYLYGSGEAAAISRQSWADVVDYVSANLARPASVVLADTATLADPAFLRCAGKPPAAVFDVDETVLLNLGFEADDLSRPGGTPFDDARWDRWEKTGAADVVPTPGAQDALDALRKMGVTVIFNTNRSAANAAMTERALVGAGLGPAEHGRTLFLMGDDATGSHKDARRELISQRYCVIAMGGDQLTDFSDLFRDTSNIAARRASAGSPGINALWGRGWFVFPNPAYGAGLNGGMNDIFPADKQWHDPIDAPAKEAH